MLDQLIRRLNRYTRHCLRNLTDPDFADAVDQAKEMLKACRNELCLHCGRYKKEHLGYCDGCRWKDGG
jgi:hypothetical protein